MAKKFYRVIKENFLWEVGAILELIDSDGGYRPLDRNDIWDMSEFNGAEYISARIVENSPDYFERIYTVNLLSQTFYKAKAEAKEIINKAFKGE